MPEFNAVQTSRFEQLVKRLLGIRQGGIMPTVAPELGVELSLPWKAELDLLAGYVPWGAASSIVAVAGQQSFVSVLNGSPSDVLLLKFTVSPFANAAAQLVRGPGVAGVLLNAANASFRDTRRASGGFPLSTSLSISVGTAALASPPAAHFRLAMADLLAHTPYTFPWVVLANGEAMVVCLEAANVGMVWSVEAYSRALLVDEQVIS